MNRVAASFVAATCGMLGVTACSGTTTSDGKPNIVATTNVWGSVASAVAGPDAHVKSLINDSNVDPHSFELGAAQAADISDASLVVSNGGGYDAYIDQVLKSAPKAKSVSAFDLRSDHTDNNEHLWFDYRTDASVANQIAKELSAIDPTHADGYTKRAEAFDESLTPLTQAVDTIATAHSHAAITETEPLPHYLVKAAGLADLTPAEFQNAVEEGNDPTPASIATFRDLLASKRVQVLIYNTQSADASTASLRKIATDSGVKIIDITETQPSGKSFVDWQRSIIDQLTAALG